jgi:hypothetical protein
LPVAAQPVVRKGARRSFCHQPASDRPAQHLHGRLVERLDLIVIEIADQRQGVQLRLEKDLVRIDVADTGNARLVHQGRLQRHSLAAKGGRESRRVEGLRERIGALAVLLQEGGNVTGQPDVPELAT